MSLIEGQSQAVRSFDFYTSMMDELLMSGKWRTNGDESGSGLHQADRLRSAKRGAI